MQTDISTSLNLDATVGVVIQYAQKKDVIIDKDAAIFLSKQEDYKTVIDSAFKDKVPFLDLKKAEEILQKLSSSVEIVFEKKADISNLEVVVENRAKRREAKEYTSKMKIIKDTDITNNTTGQGKVTDFVEFVRDRYNILSGLIKKHNNFSPVQSSGIKYSAKGVEVDVIGMVYEKRDTKTGNLMVIFDDNNGFFTAIFDKNKPIYAQARKLLNDDVVGIKGVKLDEKLIYASEIIFPDMPVATPKKSDIDLDIVFTSDAHIGSNVFFEKEFNNFIDWLDKGEDSSKIKYCVIAGDGVDGIGVYPGQDEELAVKDIYKQYEILSNYIERIPEHIETFIIPGNHDAVRRADPQPAIPKEYLKKLYGLKNVHVLGSPSMVEIEGLKMLMYHGNSMNELQAKLGIHFEDPIPVMEAYLLRRDVCTIYGGKNPVSPDKGGVLQIKEEPDIFVTGHLHSNGYGTYKKTMLINPGAWQAQTSFQKQQGHIPTPGRVPVMNMKTGKILEKVFINEVANM
ncbi:MAG: DNA polymerase II [Candidatus Diapherotrites archaeon CG09_land_8_20_14_0_10_32_12]|nr:MAG: DNA polymerase II [Candidatus Diapherotrites archaeon CG09_land_8_20_14_0_10_32_12]